MVDMKRVPQALRTLPGIGSVWPSRGSRERDRWQPLQTYLLLHDAEEKVVLAVVEIAEMLQGGLPKTATRPSYWRDDHAHAWTWAECNRSGSYNQARQWPNGHL